MDVKILTKVLAERLKVALPNIIHPSQTAVHGRKIHQTVHMIRDLIDIANNEDIPAAFIFLDQEKAFDRVNHDFLYKTMKAFGIGDIFIQWIKNIYSNCSTLVNINGFLSKPIPLRSGVRQGCPLSPMLYVLVIEILAIQLRINPNIVGFRINGEKIVSCHYMDDTTITIRENRCFKEVIKELSHYEEASGSKVNYDKTKGLWAGSWKNRRVPPIEIKWTSKNVKALGVFFGNDNPALATYNMIVPKLIKKLNYWKQFKLSQIGKARVVEIYLASKLIYAINFYPIPLGMKKDLQKKIFSFINFPLNTNTISQNEMWKLYRYGGIKLMNLEVKSQSAQAKWMIQLASDENFRLNLDIFSRLIGPQKGNITGKDTIFLQISYHQRILKTNSLFYKNCLLAVATLDIKKGIDNIDSWDNEHLFYNPVFLTADGHTFPLTDHCEKMKVFRYEQLIQERKKKQDNLHHDKGLIRLLDKIQINTSLARKDVLVKGDTGKELEFLHVSQKIIYEELLYKLITLHPFEYKWTVKFNTFFSWEHIWNTVFNFLSSNSTKTLIWQQIHLNFYNQYSYNKWHKNQEPCPLCLTVPQDRYHIIIDCQFSCKMWSHLQPCLNKLHPSPITEEEKAFGIVRKKPGVGVLMRNWLTYLMREFITELECSTYKSKKAPKLGQAKHRFNTRVEFEINKKLWRYQNDGNTATFEKFFTHNNAVCKADNNVYKTLNIYRK